MKKETILQEGNDNDFHVPDNISKEGFWLTVGKASIHVKSSEEGVSVSIYALGSENDDSISEAWATHSELQNIR